MTVRFGLDIGYKGLLAYNFTFAGLASKEEPEAWTALAVRFVETVRKIEMEMNARRVSNDGIGLTEPLRLTWFTSVNSYTLLYIATTPILPTFRHS